jgi:uncharacterized protein YjbJ (UPF0337 family)
MKKLITLFSIAALIMGVSASFASASEKMKSAGETIEGTVQDTVGAATGDTELQAKGKVNKLKGKARDVKEDTKDKIKEQLD